MTQVLTPLHTFQNLVGKVWPSRVKVWASSSLVVGPRDLTVGKHMSRSRSSKLVFVRVYMLTELRYPTQVDWVPLVSVLHIRKRLSVDRDNKYTRPDLTLFTHERRLGCQLLRQIPELARTCLAHMWSVLTKHLLAKYGAAVRECVEANVADYELVNPQLTAVYAASPDDSLATRGLCLFLCVRRLRIHS